MDGDEDGDKDEGRFQSFSLVTTVGDQMERFHQNSFSLLFSFLLTSLFTPYVDDEADEDEDKEEGEEENK